MKVAVRYYSRSGNTKKLADAVAEVAGVKAESVDVKLTEDVDVLFIANSLYWHGIDKNVKKFLTNPGAKIGKLVNVSTASLTDTTYPQMQKIADKLSLNLASEEFHCKGQFKNLHKGRPNEDDIKQVKEFAHKIVD